MKVGIHFGLQKVICQYLGMTKLNLHHFPWLWAIWKKWITGKSLSEALIFASTNPKYDGRLFIELWVQYMKIASSEHVVFMNCSECQNKNKKHSSWLESWDGLKKKTYVKVVSGNVPKHGSTKSFAFDVVCFDFGWFNSIKTNPLGTFR